MVYFVLYEEVNKGDQRCEERSRKDLSIPDGGRILRAEGEAAQGPRKCRDEIRDHEDIVPIMVIGGCYVCPASTG